MSEGQVQQLAVVTEGRVLVAWRVWLTHAQDCQDCPTSPDGRCEAGEGLWQAYRGAKQAAPAVPLRRLR